MKQKIDAIIKRLSEDKVLDQLNGHCIAASTIIQTLLQSDGIDSILVEVETIIKNGNTVRLVGFDEATPQPDTIDTHVVTITKTEPPYLIDTSIGYLFDGATLAIVREITATADPDIVAQVEFDNNIITYRLKKHPRLPSIHQKTLLDRHKTDAKLSKQLSTFKTSLIILGILGITNLLANLFILLQGT